MVYVHSHLNYSMIQVECLSSVNGVISPIRTFFFEDDSDLRRFSIISQIMYHCGDETIIDECGDESVVYRNLRITKHLLNGLQTSEIFLNLLPWHTDEKKNPVEMRLLMTLESIKNKKSCEQKKRPLIKNSDIKVEVQRIGSCGMQTGTIASSVRVTHTPTGVTHKCSEYRAQYKNKSAALEAVVSELISKGWRE
ncbi:hypothetical protein NVP2275O_093 [Vibrio phage 2.275.O._10N.286.54.E11]|nr:hypothetical protein NVP2275O_093 [Vibrio phage 2.275.O._10N.286.54.E11]